MYRAVNHMQNNVIDCLLYQGYLEQHQVINDYKDGKAYCYFSEGWLQEIYTTDSKTVPSVKFLYSKCFQSYPNPKLQPYQVWAAVYMNGHILRAYCECPAG